VAEFADFGVQVAVVVGVAFDDQRHVFGDRDF